MLKQIKTINFNKINKSFITKTGIAIEGYSGYTRSWRTLGGGFGVVNDVGVIGAGLEKV